VSGIRRLDCLYLDTTFASLGPYTREFPDRVCERRFDLMKGNGASWADEKDPFISQRYRVSL
jgi:hypothetical protein